ncbi:hopanoid biosynthesis-associated protein HpnK [Salinisphaera sp.]|uniref:hopanoid biosynthesis-associated protein HpnK n=1 Tax=Salinisphaera sp. TaxID=1914330 RepID=UPI002D776586|nr:hopanoid biosynthesis-associated protein HpnK [Salinisphaera sp.]HET7314950.1 hopanoid biosynthesis-associated protein HpnK [Salinisphaera sp.]
MTEARRIIVTADDFGLDTRVNDAVERGCRDGILNSASLMVGASAAGDAVARARRLPDLHVGLHLVLVDGRAVLPRERIPDLVDAAGRFDDNMARAGVRFAFSRRVRAQLAAEIRAQFEAFAATGLALDHVNTHKHFHLHPTILALIVDIGRDYGLRAVRLPHEPLTAGLRITRRGAGRRVVGAVLLAPWLGHMRRRIARAGLVSPSRMLGLAATGHMNEAAMLAALAALPPGVSEIYCHPATATGLTAPMADYDHPSEFAALISPRVRATLAERRIGRTTFSELGAEAA